MLHLSHVLKPIQKHHAEVVSDFVVDYCTGADTPGDQTYHYGWGSLKWALCYVAEQDPDNVGMILFHILCESIAKKMDNTWINTGILKFHSLRDFKPGLKERDPIDVTALPYEMVKGYKIVINTTGRSIAAMIERKIPNVDIIVSAHKDFRPSIRLLNRPRTKIVPLQLFEGKILDLLGTEDGGWFLLTSPSSGSTIVNNYDLDITPERIIQIITLALTN